MSGTHRTLLTALLVGLAGSLAYAAPAGSEVEPHVRVQVIVSSEQVEFSIVSNQPLAEPNFRKAGKAGRLELTLPHCALVSRAGKQALDRGVLQNVEVENINGGVLVGVSALSSPMSRATISPDHKSILWTVMTNVPGSGLPSVQVGSTAHSHPVAAEPVRPKPHPAAVAPVKPIAIVAPAPPPVVAPPPPSKPPAAPVATPRPVAVAPKPALPASRPVAAPVAPPAPSRPAAQPPVAVVAPARPAPVAPTAVVRPAAPVNPGDRLVSLTYPSGDLAGALRALARAAGLQAQIDPGVKGSVTESFTEIPLNKAVSSILGKQTELYHYEITSSSLVVTASGDSAGGSTLHPNLPGNRGLVSDYFPIRQKPVAEVYQAAHRAFPELTYQVDERLNVLFAEGEPSVMERLRKVLQGVSAK